jgi:ribosomal protein L2
MNSREKIAGRVQRTEKGKSGLEVVSVNNLELKSGNGPPLTVIKKTFNVEEDVGKGGQLLLVLQQLRQVVGDALSVVVHCVAHLRIVEEWKFFFFTRRKTVWV